MARPPRDTVEAGPNSGQRARRDDPPAATLEDVTADLAGRAAGEVLAAYLHAQANAFLRGVRAHGQTIGGAETAADAARAAYRAADAAARIGGVLLTYRPLLDPSWAGHLRSELSWLSGVLLREHAYADRLDRLLGALRRLSGTAPTATSPGTAPGTGVPGARQAPGAARQPHGTPPPRRGGAARDAASHGGGPAVGLGGAVGAARAGALLDRRLTRARARAHSAALRALGSSRFHAVVDAVALLASEVPFRAEPAQRPAAQVLPPLADAARRHLAEAVAALPRTPGCPSASLVGTLLAEQAEDTAWDGVALLVRWRRYALEALGGPAGVELEPALGALHRALERHRAAAGAAAAVSAAAATPRIAPATAYALGVLHADQRHEVEAARTAFARLWRRAALVPAGD